MWTCKSCLCLFWVSILVLHLAFVLDIHLHSVYINCADGWVGLQSGRHADKALHKYINFLEYVCVCVVNIIVQPKVTDHTSMHHQCQQKASKNAFFWSYLCSVHVQFAWQMFFLFSFLSFFLLKKYPKWICKYWLFYLYTFFNALNSKCFNMSLTVLKDFI